MTELIYKEKIFPNNSANSYLRDKKYNKVSTCPYCGFTVDAIQESLQLFNITDGKIMDITYKCTSCDKIFHVCYKKLNKEERFEPFSIFPSFKGRNFSEHITGVSSRFVKLYNQAYKAEYDGNYELAGCGYRNALEILIKDYAIKVLEESPEEVVKCKLYNAIKLYLPDVDMGKCADVVRILGNDNTHYERDYENIDFQVLKQYLNIFIDMIDVKIKIKNPPVSR
ncbi:MAG: DUF4145 domain-containing protein [Firmicutes bacterium]|nr:DUF4145 domain-containing protein [Bacillota bacterium]